MTGNQRYDVIIIGAGPAGLSAARTAARLGLNTLELEQLGRAGELGHPCGGAVAPVPGFASSWRDADGLHFPELDLLIPTSLIVGAPTVQCFISPHGHEVQAVFSSRDDFPVAVIDKSFLLQRMAGDASAAGAKLQFSTLVTGLLEEGDRIVGVQTRHERIFARMVISAEGVSRRFCEEAGLYLETPPVKRYAFIVSEDLEAPAVRAEHLGQIATFGKRYTSAPFAFGAVLLPAPGRAYIYFTVFADHPKVHTEESLWFYLDEYKQRDPRIREFFVGAKVVHQSGCRMVIRDAPSKAIHNGFVGTGDAITPGGHLGIVASMYLGRQAALTVAEAIRAGDVSAKRLVAYDKLFRGPILRGLETEGKIFMGLAAMTDEEIDRVCQTLSKLNLASFFFGEWRPIAWETLGWLARQFPLVIRDWRLLGRMMRCE